MSKDWKNFTKPDAKILKEQLSPIQYKVTQKDGTEKPFANEYNANKEEGIYVDVISGEPLFSSKDKYDSGTGWPSFYEVIKGVDIVTKEDRSIFMRKRVEVRSPIADSHLGHVFEDGPAPTNKRYCMNSAAMRFVPKDKMAEEGYADFLDIFS
jgi:methionine-R-sulfoxide reductase